MSGKCRAIDYEEFFPPFHPNVTRAYFLDNTTTVPGYLDITISYDESAVHENATEDTLDVWRQTFDSTLPEWREVTGTSRDTAANTVSANATVRGPDEIAVLADLPHTTISGQVRYPNGSAAAGEPIVTEGEVNESRFFFDVTNTTGNFTVEVAFNATYDLFFSQTNETGQTFGTPDGVPDLIALDRITTGVDPVDAGNRTLPDAHPVNVTVVDETGDGVTNATVSFVHRDDDSAADIFSPDFETGPNGRPEGINDTGLELVGNVTLEVQPPDDPRFPDQTKTVTLNVTSTETVTVTLQENETVSGQVTNASGTPLPGDNVFVVPVNGSTPAEVNRTSSTGNFTLAVAGNDTYDAVYVENLSEGGVVRDGVPDFYVFDRFDVGTGDVSLGQVTLPEGAPVVNITVLDESGDPVENATITFTHRPPYAENFSAGLVAENNTNADGMFVAKNPNAEPGAELLGNYTLAVEPPAGYVDARYVQDVQINASEPRNIVFRVASAQITGAVNESDGTPAAGDAVRAFGVGNLSFEDVTASDGSFSLAVESDRNYSVGYFQHDASGNFGPRDGSPDLYTLEGVADSSVEAGETAALAPRTLPGAHVLNVTVVNESGSRVENVTVRVRHSDDDTPAYVRRAFATNAEGNISTAGGPGVEVVGDVNVTVVAPDAERYVQTTYLRDLNITSDTKVTITLEESPIVSGAVREADGDPAVNDSVAVWREGTEQFAAALTDSNGAFAIGGWENEPLDVQYYQWSFDESLNDTAFPRDGSPDVFALARVNTSTPVDIGTRTLPGAYVVNVSVVDEDDNPVHNATVEIQHRNETSAADAGFITNTSTAGLILDGSQNLSDPAPGIELVGNVTINVTPPANDSTLLDRNYTRSLNVTSNTTVTFTLADGTPTVSGTLEDDGGAALANDSVVAYPTNSSKDPLSTGTNATGGFSRDGARNTTYDLVYEETPRSGEPLRDGVPDVYVFDTVSLGTENLGLGTVTLPTNASVVNVTVVDESGNPVEGAFVEFVDTSGESPFTTGLRVTTDAAGMANRSGAPRPGVELAGGTTVVVQPPTSDEYVDTSYRRSLNVTSNTTITITLQERIRVNGTIRESDGTPAANDTIFVSRFVNGSEAYFLSHKPITGSTGAFDVQLQAGEKHDFQYYQGNFTAVVTDTANETVFPRDGSPDLYALTQVNSTGDVDLGNRTLPEAYVVNVSVVDEDGDPVKNASVESRHFSSTSGATAGTLAKTSANGLIYDRRGEWWAPDPGIELVGNASLEVRPPANESRFYNRTYTRDLNVTAHTNLTVTLQGPQYITGRIVNESGTPLPGNNVAVNPVRLAGNVIFAHPDATGSFAANVSENMSYDVLTGDRAPRDGLPDTYVLDRVRVGETNVSLGTRTVPENASVVNVTVVDESGDPVEDAFVGPKHQPPKASNNTLGPGMQTNVDGMAQHSGEPPGIELLGNVTVIVRPPDGATRFVDKWYFRELEVTGKRSITVTLEEDADITSCRTIDQSGHYELGSNITTDGSGPCIEITASNVTLDGQSHVINMTGSGEAINITSSGSIRNVVVRNVTIVDASTGIALHARNDSVDVTGIEILENELSNVADGIRLVADGNRSTVSVAIRGNAFDTSGDAISGIDAGGTGTQVSVTVRENEIDAGESALDSFTADASDQHVNLLFAGNNVTHGFDGIDSVLASGTNTAVHIAIRNNNLTSTSESGGIGLIEAIGKNQTVDLDILDNEINANTNAIYKIDTRGNYTTTDVTIRNNVLNSSYGDGIYYLYLAGGLSESSSNTHDQHARLRVVGNHINASDDGIQNTYLYGDNTTADAVIEQNRIKSRDDDGIGLIRADSQNQTVDLAFLQNDISVAQEGVDEIDADGGDADADGSTVTVSFVENTIRSSNDRGIESIDLDGTNSTATVRILDNHILTNLTDGGDAIQDIETDIDDGTVKITIRDNVIQSGDDGIEDVAGATSAENTSFDVDIVNNTITSTRTGIWHIEVEGQSARTTLDVVRNTIEIVGSYPDEGIEEIEADDRNQTVDLRFVHNRITTNGTGIDDFELDGTNSSVRGTIFNNTFDIGGEDTYDDGIEDVDVDGDNQTVAIAVVGNRIGGFTDEGVEFEIDLINATRSEILFGSNTLQGQGPSVVGLEIDPDPNHGKLSGMIAVLHNDIRTNVTAVQVEQGPVAGINLTHNHLAAPIGVENLNRTIGTYVDATGNYWNASDGPASNSTTMTFEDPVTGTLADGNGSAVTGSNTTLDTTTANISNVHFDPFLKSKPNATFGVTVEGSNTPVSEGETLSVTATVENLDAGADPATKTVELVAGGAVRDSKTLTLFPGERRTVTLNWTTGSGDAGDYTATVRSDNGSASTAVSVGSPATATFAVGVDSTNSPVTEGGTLDVTATIENTGDASGSQTVTLSVGGSQRDSTTVSLGPGDSTTVTLSWATGSGDDGDYTATVATDNDTASTGVTVEAESTDGGGGTPPENNPPTADAGDDRTVQVGESVTLDGSGSSDPDGDTLSYSWSFVTNPGGDSLSDANTPTPSFTPSTTGTYEIDLTVSDGSATDTDNVTITVTEAPPPPTPDIASVTPGPGGDITVTFGDVDGGTTTYVVRRGTEPGGPYAEVASLTDDDRDRYEFTDANLTDGRRYYYVVVAVNAEGTGNASAEASATADASPPTISGVSLANPAGQNLTLSLSSTEQLSELAVSISGPESRALSLSDFAASETDDGFSYAATLDVVPLGDYEATVDRATDAAGNDGAAGQSAAATVSVTRSLAVTPTTHDFGPLGPGDRATTDITIQNDGNGTVSITEVAIAGTNASAFSVVDAGASSIDPGESTDVTVAFDAAAPIGPRTARLRIRTENVPEITVTLSGRVAAADLRASTREVSFFSVAVGTNATKRLAVTNEGGLPATVSAVRVTGPDAGAFTLVSGDASGTIGTNEGVDLAVRFSPDSPGEKTAVLRVESDDAGVEDIAIPLSGAGATGRINASTDSVDFGTVAAGTLATANVTVTNDGFASLSIEGASISGDGAFTVLAGGDAEIVPGEEHLITVGFRPESAGPASATLEIASDDPGQGTLTVSLAGQGAVPDATLSTTALAYGASPTNSSTTRTVTVRNGGNATLVLSGTRLGGESPGAFAVVSSGGTTSLAPGESREISVAFAPAATGQQNATLSIPSNDPEGALNVSLSGTGERSNIAVSPSAVAFGNVRVGETGDARISVQNDGSQPLDLTGIAIAGANASAFTLAGDTGTGTLAPGANRTFAVRFSPSAIGSRTATVEITSDDPDTPTVEVSLGGTGVQPDVGVAADRVAYNDTRVGGVRERIVTVRNDGNANLTVENVSVAGADADAFSLAGSRTFALGPGETRDLRVQFAPGAGGDAAATLEIASDDPDEATTTVELAGTAVAPQVTVSPEALTFGDVQIDTTVTRTVTLSNDADATAALTIRSLSIIGSDAGDFSV
ncbi:MAG: choice-of-anchor D domain-containing protein, partial [Halobacteriales archaeon]